MAKSEVRPRRRVHVPRIQAASANLTGVPPGGGDHTPGDRCSLGVQFVQQCAIEVCRPAPKTMMVTQTSLFKRASLS